MDVILSPGPVVLLVDDQIIVAAAVRTMLAAEADIAFHYCQDPEAALTTAEAVRPTTILQDLVMPDVDGFTMVQRYRDHPVTAMVPIIILSSKEDPHDKSQAIERGATDYVVKLPDRIELIARIRAHSRSFMAQQERDAAFRALAAARLELEAKNAFLERLTAIDGLTGTANRRRFDEALAAEWRRARRDGTELSLVLIDVDFFKMYNDHYGHLEGDDCLRKVASALTAGLHRPGDLVARYGGEEFVVILPGTDVVGAGIVAEALRAAVEALALPHARSAVGGCVTISLGSATLSPKDFDDSGDTTALIKGADRALYQAKRSGRNRHCSRMPG
jgi:two-component system chemotaxis family response regulator WspR